MSHVDPDQEEIVQMIPPAARTVLYLFVAVGGLATFLLTGLAPIWFPPATARALIDSATVVSGGLAIIGGAIGYSYRPTK